MCLLCNRPVSYTHLDVYKRQALIFAYLRPEQTILGLMHEDDDDDEIETRFYLCHEFFLFCFAFKYSDVTYLIFLGPTTFCGL